MSKEAAMQGYISAAMPLLKQLASLSEAQIDAYLATSIAPEERRQVGVLFKQVKAFVRDVSHYQASGRSPLTSDDEEHFSFDDMDSPKSYSSSNSEDHTPTSLQLSQNLIELPSPAAVDANSETASARDGVESEGGGGIPSIPDSPGSHASLSSNALLSRAEEAVRGDKTGEEGTVQELAAVSVSAVLTRLDQMMARIEAIEKRVQGLERGEGKWSRQASFFLCALIVALPVAVKLWHEANGRRKRFI
ncbi:hypothetical protein HK104_001874 [Borealophlyctis nickersoniae]|nr:hypothetical protein HK104_001874 [Borealophlyctis nickersoniae]